MNEKEIMRRALMTGIRKQLRLPDIGGGAQIWYKTESVKVDYSVSQTGQVLDAVVKLTPYWTPPGGTPKQIDSPAWLALIYNLSSYHSAAIEYLLQQGAAVLGIIVPDNIDLKEAKQRLRTMTKGKTWINQTAAFAPFDIKDETCVRRGWCEQCNDWSVRADGRCWDCIKREQYHSCQRCGEDAKKPYPLCWGCYQSLRGPQVEIPTGERQRESNIASIPREPREMPREVKGGTPREVDDLIAEMEALINE